MGKKRHKSKRRGKRPPGKGGGPKSAIGVRRAAGGWQLVPPRCATERAEDIEEVHAMLEAGEWEIAGDELLWLLHDCPDVIDAHLLLGMIAASEREDPELARGHFGYAYQLGIQALRQHGMPTPVPYALPANQPFFEAGKGLAHCLRQLGKPQMAREIIDRLLELDPSDPLGLTEMRRLLDEPLPGGSKPGEDGKSP